MQRTLHGQHSLKVKRPEIQQLLSYKKKLNVQGLNLQTATAGRFFFKTFASSCFEVNARRGYCFKGQKFIITIIKTQKMCSC